MDIRPYVGGESSLDGASRILKLSSNEGALGPSPKAMAALREHAAEMHRYPDGGAAEMRAALAAHHGLDPERIVCGAGSDELLGILCRAYAGPGDEVLYPQYGFLMYAIAAKACGATPVVAPSVDLTPSVDSLLAAVTERTRVVFLANPNNPTGTWVPKDEVARLRAGLPDRVLLVLDAAYAEFVNAPAYSSGFELVESHPGVAVCRTFSKLYALGGLRLGWAYASAEVTGVLNRVRNPFNVSSAALAAGRAALEDVEHTAACKAHNDTWQPWLSERLRALGLVVVPSVCNFILVRFPTGAGRDAASADAFLRARGIIVRGMAAYGLGDSLRVTIGTAEECEAVAEALAAFVAGDR